MSVIPHHTSDPVCALCETKLATAHASLGDWFRQVKSLYPDLHVSWGYRDAASQLEAFKEGKTKLNFPNSAHNKTPALALDLFQIDEQGKAKWDGVFFAKLDAFNQEKGHAIKWGGHFKHLGDFDHFELEHA
jgi:hypothetical protein